ncbi:UV excision repair protein rad23 [Tritrichomonas musculus]|uniref:UV excision repair protein RAD23 n=1 Tax=Tritrichomonas musculus TaxID=1915356 RepID=A0ABR2L661_9EUKA
MQNMPQTINAQDNFDNSLIGIERERNNLNQQIFESLNLNINLTEADNLAISRLVEAGYDRVMALQVYVTCDKNEEAAMNLLVSMG